MHQYIPNVARKENLVLNQVCGSGGQQWHTECAEFEMSVKHCSEHVLSVSLEFKGEM